MQTERLLRPLPYKRRYCVQHMKGICINVYLLAGVGRPAQAPLRPLRWQAAHWSRKLCQGLHPGQDWHTDSDRQAGHVVHDYYLVTSNSDILRPLWMDSWPVELH